MKVRKIFKYLGRNLSLGGALRGVVGAAVAGIGWKIASDIYDVVKDRIKEAKEAAESEEVEPGR